MINVSRLTGSESQGQEEAVCVCPAYVTIGVFFTNECHYIPESNQCCLATTLY